MSCFAGDVETLILVVLCLVLAQNPMATIRNLKIKTSTCKRIVKELHSYEKEVEREAAKTADMKDKGADPYDLKQQVQISLLISLYSKIRSPSLFVRI